MTLLLHIRPKYAAQLMIALFLECGGPAADAQKGTRCGVACRFHSARAHCALAPRPGVAALQQEFPVVWLCFQGVLVGLYKVLCRCLSALWWHLQCGARQCLWLKHTLSAVQWHTIHRFYARNFLDSSNFFFQTMGHACT